MKSVPLLALSLGMVWGVLFALSAQSQDPERDDFTVQIVAQLVLSRGVERIEFGMVPAGGEVDDIIKPRERFVSVSYRSFKWLHSSPIQIPVDPSLQDTGMMAAETDELTVRIVARWREDRHQIEFGLKQLVDGNWGAVQTPRARFFPLDTMRNRWLFSSEVPLEVPGRRSALPPGQMEGDEAAAPHIDSLRCAPSAPQLDERVTCHANLSGGDPDRYSWSGGGSPSSGGGATFTTSFNRSGSHTIRLEASNTAGRDSEIVTVRVVQRVQVPRVDSVSCAPTSPRIGDSVTCWANLSGGAPERYSWSGGGSPRSGNGQTFMTTFDSSGTQRIRVDVSNSAGSDSATTTVSVASRSNPPQVLSISCSQPTQASVTEWRVDCTANIGGGEPNSYSWSSSGSPASGSQASYSTWFEIGDDGRHTIRLTVSNGDGSGQGSRTVTIPYTAPVEPKPIRIASVSCHRVGQTSQYECSVQYSGDVTSYRWSVRGGSGILYSAGVIPSFWVELPTTLRSDFIVRVEACGGTGNYDYAEYKIAARTTNFDASPAPPPALPAINCS